MELIFRKPTLIIREVESKWLDLLFEESKMQFEKVNIQSHDHLHALRTWNIAKEIFSELEKKGLKVTKNDLEKAIVAIFFHDMGFVRTVSEKHGMSGREICGSFFKNRKLMIDGFDEVLDMIQKHEDKNLSYAKEISPSDVASILRVSDDLDAFGALGVFRYLDAYIKRGINVNELSAKVIENLNFRFSNFQILFKNFTEFSNKQEKRYRFTRIYFEDLGKEIEEKGYSKNTSTGAIGVFNFFLNSIEDDKPISKLSDEILGKSNDVYVTNFFMRFKNELKSKVK
jgi:HD superfamily phosphodiesterase